MTTEGNEMTDIEQLLHRVGRACETEPSADVVEADVRRGRAAMVRRRRRRAVWSGVAGAAAVAVIVSTLVGSSPPARQPAPPRAQDTQTARPHFQGPPHRSGPTSGASHKHRAGRKGGSRHRLPPVRLVAYTGQQPAGFIVKQAPAGWYIQPPDHASYSLTIAPDGDTTSPDAFVNKLVVTLLSSSVPQKLPADGVSVQVNGQPGVISDGSPATTLTYRYPDGRYVQIQAWDNLGWNDDQLIQFAEGVTVTGDAKAGSG
jgi:hypothetical protein